jgi:hypothetical protein
MAGDIDSVAGGNQEIGDCTVERKTTIQMLRYLIKYVRGTCGNHIS